MPDGATTVVPQLTVAQMIEKYIQLRDKQAKLKQGHAEQLKPIIEAMAWLEGKMMAGLDHEKLDSMRAEAGTVFVSTETSVTVKEWRDTFEFIQTNLAWDLLEARVNKTAALAVMEETGKPIPGVQVTQARVVRVRRS